MKKTIAKRPQGGIARSPFGSAFSRGLFDDLFDRYLSETNGEMPQMINVSMDVAETEQAFEVKVDLPGLSPDDVDIQIDNNTLTIRGQRSEETEEKDDEKQYHRIERYRGSFARSVVLPNSINEDETAAEFKDGVLQIVIPKSEEAKPKKINISK
jgi:HSP20 family protein